MKQKEKQVACPNCYQMNHYNATKCAYCHGDTWRTPRGIAHDPSNFGSFMAFLFLTFVIGALGGGGAAVIWAAFWGMLWIGERLGLESFGLTVLAGLMIWLIFF